MTAVKVGDRVRVTCGKSVLVGKVTGTSAGTYRDSWLYVTIEDDDGPKAFDCARWTVEVLPPPVPDVIGTTIRDGDGYAWQRRRFGWYRVGSNTCRQLADIGTDAHIAVLWTPEVTS